MGYGSPIREADRVTNSGLVERNERLVNPFLFGKFYEGAIIVIAKEKRKR